MKLLHPNSVCLSLTLPMPKPMHNAYQQDYAGQRVLASPPVSPVDESLNPFDATAPNGAAPGRPPSETRGW